MIKGIRMIIQDKLALREQGGILRQAGRPMDILNSLPKDIKLLHVLDLNAKNGNTTNFDLYDHITYALNLEVETSAVEKTVKMLLARKARVVLELPCALDLGKFAESRRLFVGKTDGKEKNKDMHDYYIETEDLPVVKKLAKEGARVLLYSKTISDEDAEKAGVFALIRDY